MSTEPVLYEFDHKTVVRALMVSAGVKSGLWRFAARFKIVSINLRFSGEDEDMVAPAVAGGIDRLALVKADKMGPLVFDAEELLKDKSVAPIKSTTLPDETVPGKKATSTKKAVRRKTSR